MTIERLTSAGLNELRDAGGRTYPQVIRVSGGTQVFLSDLMALDGESTLIGSGDMAAQANWCPLRVLNQPPHLHRSS